MLVRDLIDDLRDRTDQVDEIRDRVRRLYSDARTAGRTQWSYQEWREDLLAQVAVGWVLASVFVRFCEDNALVDTPLLSGPGERRGFAQDHRVTWLAQDPEAGDRKWLSEVFARYRAMPATAELFGDRNPLSQFGPSDDGARQLLDLWWRTEDETGDLSHDFTDPALDTRFLGDLYQDLSEHAKKTYALLQTPEFVEEFILDRTLDPAIETFGLADTKMIDPACGSGHFLLGAFDRLLRRWQEREPGTRVRDLVERVLDAVNGIDVNPFAVAIARFRLLVAVLQVTGIAELADAPAFRINVAVGDSLLHSRRSDELFARTTELEKLLNHRYPAEDRALAGRLLSIGQYQVVVGNPPYITVKDKALNSAYRKIYDTCHMKYSLGVPFTELFFNLARPRTSATDAGYVGLITANSFMKRQFGKKLIEDWLPRYDLTHVVNTSGAYIPGHGTPTVILLGRNQRPEATAIRAVLGIKGEPERPRIASQGHVWTSILQMIDHPGSENDFVSVEDVPRSRLESHPWSLQGGAAPSVKSAIEAASVERLDGRIHSIGFQAITGEDDAFAGYSSAQLQRRGIGEEHRVSFVTGELLRDWATDTSHSCAVFPYHSIGLRPDPDEAVVRHLWAYRTNLEQGLMFGKTKSDREMEWYEYTFFSSVRYRASEGMVFAFVATHNHFAHRNSKCIYNRSVPTIILLDDTTGDDILGLLGALNSSTACFWMKQVFYPKGGDPVGAEGARVSAEGWDDRYEFDGTKLRQFPLPRQLPTRLALALNDAAHQIEATLPIAVVEAVGPSRSSLETAQEKATVRRGWMVALQEELDWRCYQLYGLIDDDLIFDLGRLPALQLGERAFEIALARRLSAGDESSTWFERHGSIPVTELPTDWPSDYRELVEGRLELIESDRSIGLLERPEYKRRWNWDSFADLQRTALRDWMADRLEDRTLWEQPLLSTCARLADAVRTDPQFVEAAQLYTGSFDVDLTALVTELVLDDAVPYAAGYRYKPSGLRKRRVWEQTWERQREEDDIDARMRLDPDDTDYLDDEAAGLEKKRRGLDSISVPPKYASKDFAKTAYWRLRGKLDVPKERFILYPDTLTGSDHTPVIGWAGWNHLRQAQALAAHYNERKDGGAEANELAGLLAGLVELVPWLKQWHNDMDPQFGRLGDFFEGFSDTEARTIGLTAHDLRTWTPE